MTSLRLSEDSVIVAWRTVLSGATRVQARIDERLETERVPPAWFPVLQVLLDADDHRLPMSVLARDVSMTSGGFTKLADRMARDGVIDRRGSSQDRRIVNARLTESGLGLARRAMRVYRDALYEFVLGVLDARELESAAQVLGTLSGALPGAGPADAPVDGPLPPAVVLMSPPDPAQPDRRGRGRSHEGV